MKMMWVVKTAGRLDAPSGVGRVEKDVENGWASKVEEEEEGQVLLLTLNTDDMEVHGEPRPRLEGAIPIRNP